MESSQILAGLKSKRESQLAQVEAMQSDVKSEIDQIDQLTTAITDEKKAEHEAGFQEGLNQSTAPGDKVYSDEEMEAELKPLREKITALEGQAEEQATKVAALEEKVAAAETAAQNATSAMETAIVDKKAAQDELAAIKADMQAKVNEVFGAKMNEVLAKLDEIESKEEGDVEHIKAAKASFAELVPPVVPQPEV